MFRLRTRSERPRPPVFWLIIRLIQLAVAIALFGLTLHVRLGKKGNRIDKRNPAALIRGGDDDDFDDDDFDEVEHEKLANASALGTVSLRVLFIATISAFLYCLASLFAYARRKVSPKITLFIDSLHIAGFAASVALVVLVLTRYNPWKSPAMHWAILILSAVILGGFVITSFVSIKMLFDARKAQGKGALPMSKAPGYTPVSGREADVEGGGGGEEQYTPVRFG